MCLRLVVMCLLFTLSLFSQAPALIVPDAAQASPDFNAKLATDAWLQTTSPANRAASDAYFEGGYWLILWDFLYGAALFLLLLECRLSARMRNLAAHFTGHSWLQSFWYSAVFIGLVAMSTLPLTLYQSFFRERAYGLLSQNFASWFWDQLIGFALTLVVASALLTTLMALVRRFPRTWPAWATGITAIFIAISALVTPVYISPLFNTYTPLPKSRLTAAILSLARANGVPAAHVYVMDESRQSKRISANVSGFWGTERITLNDNLLRRCSPEGVLSTMGHEVGHYVLHHIPKGIFFFSVVAAILFAALQRIAGWALRWRGKHWQIKSITDVAVLPLAALILSTLLFLLTPLLNTYTRTEEYEADIYGLNAARQPDGEAQVDLLLGEYRKLDPTPLEEFIFFDHPSGRTRIYAAMLWKAENLCLFDRALPCDTSTKQWLPHEGKHPPF